MSQSEGMLRLFLCASTHFDSSGPSGIGCGGCNYVVRNSDAEGDTPGEIGEWAWKHGGGSLGVWKMGDGRVGRTGSWYDLVKESWSWLDQQRKSW
jgi:hypothetical protein